MVEKQIERIFTKALSQKTVDIQGFFTTRLRVILSEDPPRSHFGYASCFWDKSQTFDKLRMTRRVEVEIRPSGGSNAFFRVWNLVKNQSIHVTEPSQKLKSTGIKSEKWIFFQTESFVAFASGMRICRGEMHKTS